MATIYYESDTDPALLGDRKVAVIGYGSQGHAHALNLRDSGIDVRVGLRPGSASREAAPQQGLRVLDTNDAAAEADVVVVLAPDQLQPQLWDDGLREVVTAGDALVFGHGFSIHFGFVTPPDDVDVLMVAPKSPGHMVRNLYADGQGTPGLVAVHQDATGNAHGLALSYGAAIGCARAGLLQTTFAEETESDLFGEQAVLCGGMSELVQAGFETLVEAGYQPEIAYFECLHEMKLIVDFAYEKGLSGMWYTVSETAEYGGLTRGKRVIDADARATMRTLLSEVRDGTFAREWMEEHRGGAQHFGELREQASSAQIEQVGAKLRAMMPWLAGPSA